MHPIVIPIVLIVFPLLFPFDGTTESLNEFQAIRGTCPFDCIHELINNRTGILDEAEIVKRLKDTVSQDIINDRDNMSKLFNDTDGKNTKALEDRVTAEIGTIVKKNCQKKNFKRTKEFPKFNVAVSSEELKKLPNDAIQTCKLKFTPTSFNIHTDNEDSLSASVSIEDIIK